MKKEQWKIQLRWVHEAFDIAKKALLTILIIFNIFLWGGGPLQVESRSDKRLELLCLLEEPSGNCQMTHIIHSLFQGM